MKRLFLLSLFTLILTGCGNDSSGVNPPDGNDSVYYTVTFDSRGGTVVESQRILAGNPVVEPEPPRLDGYFLNGWYTTTEINENSRWDFDVDRVNQDLTLYAGWTEIIDEESTEGLVFELNEDNSGYILRDYEGEATRIIIPEVYNDLPVLEIQGQYGTGALARTNIISIKIPDNLEVIGQNTFNNCSLLERVEISENSKLREIGNNAFSGCGSLESLYIPSGVTTIGNSAFNNCGSINEFNISEENIIFRSENGHLIENSTNKLLRGANNFTIPSGVEIIDQSAFRRSKIDHLYIPLSVKEIGNYFIADGEIEVIN